MTDEEKEEWLPRGKQLVYKNRIGWALTYLKKANLIDSPTRATFLLTELGHAVLKENPDVIDQNYLKRFDGFNSFIKSVENINGISKENLVVDLLVTMGYGGSKIENSKVLGKSGDEGIDGVIMEDKLGFDKIYIQTKRWDVDKTVGRPELQKFVGALTGQGASKGAFITTAGFSKEAREYVNKQHACKIVLVEGQSLAALMIEHNLGVSVESTYLIKKIDSDYFNE